METPRDHQIPEGWTPLGEAVRRTSPIVDELMRKMAAQVWIYTDCQRTRRTVQVATRKYRARKRRH